MKINRLSRRHVIFTSTHHKDWILHMHLIKSQKHNFIIDTGFGPKNIEEIFAEGGRDKPYILINTHSHWDHIWGNCAAKGFPIVAHKLCSELMDKNFDSDYTRNSQYSQGNVIKQNPTVLFEKELYFPEDKIRLIYTPGHTIDSISIYDEQEKVLNAADNIGDIGNPLVPHLDCDEQIYKQTLLIYNSLGFETCICAHNDIFGKDIVNKILNELNHL